jgi:RNA polymerase sigma factor (sigma-70 family)
MNDQTVPPGRSADELTAGSPDGESTAALLERVRTGDAGALETLFARHLQPLKRWTSGRLPRWARDLADTTDLVQDVLLNTFNRIEGFRPQHEHAFAAYLHQAVLNRIRDEYRRNRNRPIRRELDDEQQDGAPSPLDHAVAAELLDDYQAALDALQPEDRDLIVSRVEVGLTYEEIAETMEKPNANAARSAVVRALERLGRSMRHEG